MNNIYEILKELGVDFEEHRHEPVYTVDEAEKVSGDIPGVHSKNLFLRNTKGDQHYLVVMPARKRFRIKDFGRDIGEKHLSFASPERLKKHLGVIPGSVTPLALVNDEDNHVSVFVDREMVDSERVNFHPNSNDTTLNMSADDFRKFLDSTGNDILVKELN